MPSTDKRYKSVFVTDLQILGKMMVAQCSVLHTGWGSPDLTIITLSPINYSWLETDAMLPASSSTKYFEAVLFHLLYKRNTFTKLGKRYVSLKNFAMDRAINNLSMTIQHEATWINC